MLPRQQQTHKHNKLILAIQKTMVANPDNRELLELIQTIVLSMESVKIDELVSTLETVITKYKE